MTQKYPDGTDIFCTLLSVVESDINLTQVQQFLISYGGPVQESIDFSQGLGSAFILGDPRRILASFSVHIAGLPEGFGGSQELPFVTSTPLSGVSVQFDVEPPQLVPRLRTIIP